MRKVLNFTGETLLVFQVHDPGLPETGPILVSDTVGSQALFPEPDAMQLVRINGMGWEFAGDARFQVFTERLSVLDFRLPEADEIFVVTRDVAEYIHKNYNGYRQRFVVPGADVVTYYGGKPVGCRGFNYI